MALEINIASSRLSKEPRARDLIEHLKTLAVELGMDDGVVYYDYPLFRDTDDVLYRSKILLVSRTHGLAIIFPSELSDRTCTHEEIEKLDEQLSQLLAIIYGRLLKSRLLRKSRQQLLFTPLAFILLPDVTRRELAESDDIESQIVYSVRELDEPLAEAALDDKLPAEAWSELRSIIEGAKGLLRPKERTVPASYMHGKAALLARLETEIANFDVEQRRAAISIVEGPQRIRGLAGSGKTVVLAMKAALIHLSEPEARLLVTFHTKSLYDFIKRLITRFYRQFNDVDPDFENRVHVLHSWGGRNTPGVYYNACMDAGIPTTTYSEALGQPQSPFQYVCRQAVTTGRIQKKYDFVLIDEAQDLPQAFFQLCFRLTKGGNHDRNVVWAYDELQNIMNVRMLNAQKAFGSDESGVARIDLERAADRFGNLTEHDIVLHRCYRNPREILLCTCAWFWAV